MTGTDAVSAIAGLQTSLATLRGHVTPASSSSASVFAALLAQLGAATPMPSASDAWGQQIVDDARGFLGTPYVLGGTTKSGIDCSGLVKTVLAKYGVDAPHHSGRQGELGTEVPSLAEARPGDLIVTNGGRHIVIYAGDNKVIHAPSPGKNVVEQELWTGDAGIVTIRRIDPPASQQPTLPTIDMQSVLAGLALLGGVAGSLGGASTAPYATGASLLGGSSFLSPTLSPDLASLALQRFALQQKGTA